jgi:catechol 2,3-dioxygenase-like lactoylglutathione lyase family enzyme
MFDHVGIYTGGDLRKQGAFYAAVLAPLGLQLLGEFVEPDGAGRLVFGTGARGAAFFVIAKARENPSWWRPDQRQGASAMHLAFQAPSAAAVDAFHAIGVREGARDNGAPGDRGHGYYAAYLIDADGNGIEAGWRAPAAP